MGKVGLALGECLWTRSGSVVKQERASGMTSGCDEWSELALGGVIRERGFSKVGLGILSDPMLWSSDS